MQFLIAPKGMDWYVCHQVVVVGNMECGQGQSQGNMESDWKGKDQVHGSQWVYSDQVLNPVDSGAVIIVEGNLFVH